MNSYTRFFALAALMTVFSSVGCRKTPALAETAPRAVRVATVRKDSLEKTRLYAGALEPKYKIDLSFGIGGKVASISSRADKKPITEGDIVKRGQLLAELDDTTLKLESTAASFAATSAAAEVVSSTTAAEQAVSDLTRAEKLAAAGAITQVELEKTKTASQSAKAKLDVTRAQQAAKSEQVAIAKRIEKESKLYSPIDGVIARKMVDEGERVTPSTIAFTIIDTSEMKLVFAIPDIHLSTIKLGQIIVVRAEAIADTTLAGKITQIAPVADPALRTFTVEVTLDNHEGKLRAGMVANAFLNNSEKPLHLWAPLSAVVRGTNRVLGVFVVENNRVSFRQVTISDFMGNEVQIDTGLNEAESIVIDGAALLHDGERVESMP